MSAIQISEINPSAIQMKPYYMFVHVETVSISTVVNTMPSDFEIIYTHRPRRHQPVGERENANTNERTNGKSNEM